MKKKKTLSAYPVLRWVILFLLLGISSFALLIRPVLPDNSGTGFLSGLIIAVWSELSNVQLAHVLALAVVAVLDYRMLLREDKPLCLTALILSLIFSAFMLIGLSFSQFFSFDFILRSRAQLVISTVVYCGYLAILYPILKLLFEKLDGMKRTERIYTETMQWIDLHLGLVCIATMAICWGLFWLAFFPGNVMPDGKDQLQEYFGINLLRDRNPYTATVIMGFFYDIGRHIGGNQWGIGLYILLQQTLGIAVFRAVCLYIRNKGMPLGATLAVLAFFSLMPLFGMYMSWLVKDTPFVLFLVWFLLEYIREFLGDRERFGALRLFLSGFLVCLFRHDGVYIIFPALLVLFFTVSEKKRIIAVVLITTVGISFLMNPVLRNMLEIQHGSVAEAMSLPFQSTARYVREYGDELTEEEKQVIDRLLDYESLAEKYNPVLSDPIKATYRETATREDWEAFIRLWFQNLSRHPRVYADAIICHAFGYTYPFYSTSDSLSWENKLKLANLGAFEANPPSEQVVSEEGLNASDERQPYTVFVFPEAVRVVANGYYYAWIMVPGLSFFVRCGSYTWAAMIMIAALLRKRKIRPAFLFIAPVLHILGCMGSPVNSDTRYMLPVMASIPLYIFLTWLCLTDNKSGAS